MEATHTHTKFEIFVDKQKFEVTQDTMTGQQLRDLPSPPIGEDRDLYLEQPDDEDLLIEPQDSVTIKDGMHFFSVPKHINPGL